MKEITKLVAVLTLICSISGLLMFFVYTATKEPIAIAMAKDELDAVSAVMPPSQGVVSMVLTQEETVAKFFIGTNGTQIAGIATRAKSVNGYGGDINVMVGLTSTGTVQAVKVLTPLFETPGLGANVKSDKWTAQFYGKPAAGKWSVRKDDKTNPQAIDSITAATISSRAVVEAVAAAIEGYSTFEAQITARMATTGDAQ